MWPNGQFLTDWIDSIRTPASTVWSAATSTRSTVPGCEARISFCIFIASSTSRSVPVSTRSPAPTRTSMIRPCIRARISSNPPAVSLFARRPAPPWRRRPIETRRSQPPEMTSTPSAPRGIPRPQNWRPSQKRSEIRPSGSSATSNSSAPSFRVTRQRDPRRSTTNSSGPSPPPERRKKTCLRIPRSSVSAPQRFPAGGRAPSRGRRGCCGGAFWLPVGERDRGEENVVGKRRRRVEEAFREAALEPLRVEGAGQELRVLDEPAEERQRRLDSGDLVFRERPGETGDRPRAVGSGDDQFAEHRVVIERHGAALLDADVVANAGAGRQPQRGDLSWRGGEVPARILGVHAALDRVAARGEIP